MKQDDRRIKMTKIMLKEALLNLMKEKPIGKITATELCKTADINRSTFYNHYNYPEEILTEIENSLYASIKNTFENSDGKPATVSLLNKICCEIKKNATLCRIILSGYHENDVLSRLIAIAYQKTIGELQQKGIDTDSKLFTKYFLYQTSGSIAVIREWINNGMPETPKEIAGILDDINNINVPFIDIIRHR